MKIKKILIVLLAFSLIMPATALAAEDVPEPSQTQVRNEQLITITPDSVFYPLKLLIESISISLTFDEDSKALLIVKYANRRLLEAEIMSEEDNEELAQELLDDCLKLLGDANAILVDIAPESKTEQTAGILDELADVGEEVIIALELTLSENIDDEKLVKLLEKAEEVVVKTLATQVFLASKDNFFEAKDDFTDARDAFKDAKESGDEEAIAAAKQAKEDAEAYKSEMEETKDGFEELKDNIMDSYENEDEDEDTDKDGEEDGEGKPEKTEKEKKENPSSTKSNKNKDKDKTKTDDED